jgi:hypothetical protein
MQELTEVQPAHRPPALRPIPLQAAEHAHRLIAAEKVTTLAGACNNRYGKACIEYTSEQHKEMLDLIANSKSALLDPGLSQGVEFFAFLRNLTAGGTLVHAPAFLTVC